MKKLVIYTCITGGYDDVKDPLVVSPDVDYIYFSDSPVDCSVWQVRLIEHREADNLLTTRWHKLNPHVLFPDYEYSLWMDGNVTILSQDFYDLVDKSISSGALWAGIRHPDRDDVYDEAYKILYNGTDTFSNLYRSIRFLKKEGFPRHWGMMECNVILRKHGDDRIIATDGLWWDFFTTFSRRDQMGHSYCMWRNGIPMAGLLPEGFDCRSYPALGYVAHGVPYVKKKDPISRIKAWIGAFRLFCFRCLMRLNGTPLDVSLD